MLDRIVIVDFDNRLFDLFSIHKITIAFYEEFSFLKLMVITPSARRYLNR